MKQLTEAQRAKKLAYTVVYMQPELLEKFKRVSERLAIPVATMGRMALMEKYAEQLRAVEIELQNERA